MTAQQPPTEAEIAALREIGYVRVSQPSWVLEIYRAGFANGRDTAGYRAAADSGDVR